MSRQTNQPLLYGGPDSQRQLAGGVPRGHRGTGGEGGEGIGMLSPRLSALTMIRGLQFSRPRRTRRIGARELPRSPRSPRILPTNVGMEATHAAYPIRQQTVPHGTRPFAKPLISRGFPDGYLLAGGCFLSLNTVVFRDLSIPVPSMEHPTDTEDDRDHQYYGHHPADRKPYATPLHSSASNVLTANGRY